MSGIGVSLLHRRVRMQCAPVRFLSSSSSRSAAALHGVYVRDVAHSLSVPFVLRELVQVYPNPRSLRERMERAKLMLAYTTRRGSNLPALRPAAHEQALQFYRRTPGG